MSRIIIHEPHIIKIGEKSSGGGGGDKSRLIALIERPDEDLFELFYEVDSEYSKYFCVERSDAFLVGILEYAMFKNFDIECIAPVTERLYYQLVSYYIPIVSKNISYHHQIAIFAPLIDEDIPNEYAVGTGFSAGVDSFYTVLKHLNSKEGLFKLTHLVFANAGALTYEGGDISKNIFEKKLLLFQHTIMEIGLPLIAIHTNYMEFYYNTRDGVCWGSLKIGSCIHALSKLFCTYYIASGFALHHFHFNENDSAFYDLFNVYSISTNTLTFHSSGHEVERIQKIEYMINNKWVKKTLCVCADLFKTGDKLNCSRCSKCIRTMMELYALGKLDDFADVFDIQDFKQHMARRIGINFARKVEMFDGFNDEFIDAAKRNHVKIPFMAHIFSIFVYKPMYFFIRKLRKYTLIRKLYYYFNIDVLRCGKIALKHRQEL
jgi:hypothetical protein